MKTARFVLYILLLVVGYSILCASERKALMPIYMTYLVGSACYR